MKIKLKRFDESRCRHCLIGTFNISNQTTVFELKKMISEKISLETVFFHLEAFVFGVKILLTDSFSLEFFFDCSILVVFLEIHKPLETVEANRNLFYDMINAAKSGEVLLMSDLLYLSNYELLDTPHLNGWRIIHYVATYGYEKLLQLLIDLNCNFNQETDDGWTPLILAAAHRNESCVNLLLKQPGIQKNKVTKRGSALHVAVEYNNYDIVFQLLNAKISCNLENNEGKIALELANDERILELIPRFIGMWEIKKYSKKDKPDPYNGNVMKYSQFKLKDKQVFLNLNLEKGTLEEYDSKENFSKNKYISLYKIKNINHIGPGNSKFSLTNKNFFFEVSLSDSKKVYYTHYEEHTNQWIKQICNAINYCQENDIEIIDSEENNSESDYEYLIPEEKNDNMINCFERVKEIGAGSFGTVYKVVKKDTGKVYAMKCLSKVYLKRKDMLKYAISEIKIMQQLFHPFVLCLNYAFENSNCLYLIMEYCELGDLETYLDINKISIEQARVIIGEIVLGLEYIHSLDIIYRDLKPSNVLIDENSHIRLADFGFAKNFIEENAVSTLLGSPAYVAPEIISREKVNTKADLYSLGVTIHEILTGRVPFASEDIEKLFSAIEHNKILISKDIDKNAKDLIKTLMNRNPKKRPNYKTLKNHKFFKGINWDDLLNKKYFIHNLITNH